jgi:hypothetical protein
MKLPRRIADILKQKQELINKYRDKLDNTVVRLQSELFNKAVTDLIPKLDVKGGIIQDTENNYRVISEVDKLYSEFNKQVLTTIFPEVAKGTNLIAQANNSAFSIVLSKELPSKFDRIVEGARKLIDLRLGVKGGQPVRGGFLMSILKETGATEFKQLVSQAVTSQVPMKEFITTIKEKLVGGEKKYGSLQRQLQRFTYDIYQQYDAAYNLKLAREFGLTWFVYQGGLVEDSRDFCREHNAHVYSIEETKVWPEWTPSKAVNITEFTQKDLDKVPSYMNFPGYDPLIDRGGYNCRHQLGFIPDDLAKEMRKGEG